MLSGVRKGISYKYLTGSGIVCTKPSVLLGIVMRVSVTGASLAIYDGVNTAANRMVDRPDAASSASNTINYFGLRCNYGIYIDFGNNVTSVLVAYDIIDDTEQIIEVQSG